MLILVLGNINSGKSTLIEKLKLMFANFQVLKIDNYRKINGDGSLKGELKVQDMFLKDVENAENAIVEFTGLGAIADEMAIKIRNNPSIVFKMVEDVELCIERIEMKNFKEVPYPKFDESIQNTILRLDREINNGNIERIWKDNVIRIFDIKPSEVDNFSYESIFYLSKVLDVLISLKECRQLLVFGSFLNGEFRCNSDIDLLLVTPFCINEVKKILSKIEGLSFIDNLEGKLTLYFQDILIEVHLCNKMKDKIYYYFNSIFDESEYKRSILKGDSNTYEEILNHYIAMKDSLEVDVEAIVKRLVFYLRSLPRVAHDDYKFYFHNNIVLHEIIKLKAILNGENKYNYLPKNAKKYLNNFDEYLYFSDKDKCKHISFLNLQVDKILSKFGIMNKKMLPTVMESKINTK